MGYNETFVYRRMRLRITSSSLRDLPGVVSIYMSKACWVCLIVPLFASLAAWYPGYSIGKRIGTVASHAIAWQSMFSAVAIAHLIFGYIDRPATFSRDLHEGLSLSAMFLGMMFATPITMLFALAVMIYPKHQESELTADISFPDMREIQNADSKNPYSPPRSIS